MAASSVSWRVAVKGAQRPTPLGVDGRPPRRFNARLVGIDGHLSRPPHSSRPSVSFCPAAFIWTSVRRCLDGGRWASKRAARSEPQARRATADATVAESKTATGVGQSAVMRCAKRARNKESAGARIGLLAIASLLRTEIQSLNPLVKSLGRWRSLERALESRARHMPTQLGEWAYGAWSPFYGRG
jgi:hypothetical protein